MSAQKLMTEHLDLWTGAIASKSSSGRGSSKIELTGVNKLRELILELAIRGKLTQQSSDDEPAKFLLDRIRARKTILVRSGEIKKQREIPSMREMTRPFSLPTGWEWAQLEDVGHDWGQKVPNNDFSYIDVGSIDNLRGKIKEPSILSPNDAPSRARKIVKYGTLVYSTIRPYLQNIAVVEDHITPEPIASTAFAVIHPLEDMPARFLLHYLRSPSFVRYVESIQTGIAYPAINDKQFFSGMVPVPPLSEQHRIVQKVDELMALCDRLEQQTSDQLGAHETLVDTLLGTLTQSENAKDLADNWARLATHFDTLFTTEQSIDKLKQTILQLAVMGLLVEQDAGDEPASDLLRRIKDEKAKLIRDKKLKKQEELPEAGEEEKPFRMPASWLWARLGDYSADIHYGYTASANESLSDFRLLRITDIQDDKVAWETVPGCEITKAQADQYLLSEGDILIARTGGTIGKSYLVENIDVNAVFASYLIRVRKLSSTYSKYVKIFLGSQMYWNQLYKASMGTGQPNVNGKALKNLLLPVPPLSEQFRIVRRVEDLLKICDELKERLNQASETRCQLADAIVEGALH